MRRWKPKLCLKDLLQSCSFVQVIPSGVKARRSRQTSGSSENPFCFAALRPYPNSLNPVRIAFSPQSSPSPAVFPICRYAIRLWEGDSWSHCSSCWRRGVLSFGLRPRRQCCGVSCCFLAKEIWLFVTPSFSRISLHGTLKSSAVLIISRKSREVWTRDRRFGESDSGRGPFCESQDCVEACKGEGGSGVSSTSEGRERLIVGVLRRRVISILLFYKVLRTSVRCRFCRQYTSWFAISRRFPRF